MSTLSICSSYSWSKPQTQNTAFRIEDVVLLIRGLACLSLRWSFLPLLVNEPWNMKSVPLTQRGSLSYIGQRWRAWLYISIDFSTNACRYQTFVNQNTIKRHQTVEIKHSWWVNCYLRHAEGRRSHRHLWPIRRWCLMTVMMTSFWLLMCGMLIVCIQRNRSDHL